MGLNVAARTAGFATGVRCGMRGLGRCITTPALWLWALGPALVTTVLFVLPLWWTHDALTERMRSLVGESWGEGWGTAVSTTLTVVFVVVAVLLLYLVFAPVARVVAAPFLAVLSDRTVRGIAGAEPPPFAGSRFRRWVLVPVRDALVFLVIRLFVTVLFLPLLCVPVVGPLLLFLVLAPLEGLDRIDVAQSSRAVPVNERIAFIGRNFGACFGLGVVAAGLLLVPVANVLLLPGIVVGAVLLDAEVSPDFPGREAPSPAPAEGRA